MGRKYIVKRMTWMANKGAYLMSCTNLGMVSLRPDEIDRAYVNSDGFPVFEIDNYK